MPKGVETQDKRGDGQLPQDYPESLEPGEHKNETRAQTAIDKPLNAMSKNALSIAENPAVCFLYVAEH